MKHKPVRTDYSWRKKRIILYLLTIVFILMIPSIILTFYVFRHVKYMAVDSDAFPLQKVYKAEDFLLADVEHTIRTEDGETLWCSEICTSSPKGVVIFLGPMKEPSVTYFYGHAAWMKKKDFASFLLEVRGHGRSTGKKQGLGYTEVEDVRALVKYIKSMDKYKNLPIIVQGVDLGGTIALNAIGQIPEIDACIALSPYASPDTQIDLLMKKYYIPGFLRKIERPIIHQTLRLLYGKETADEINPEVQVKNAENKPILIIAAYNDPEVSVENSLVLQKTSSKAEVWIRDSEDHFIVEGNEFKNVEKDIEYCVYVSGFLFKVVQGK